jgi:serine/threonine-protein kinase HipA
MKNEIAVLEIFLGTEQIGTIAHLFGDKNVFSFTQEYIENKNRATLSLAFKDEFGNLITDIKSTRTRLTPFFSNLLPEGYMRDYLSSRSSVNPKNEFDLLAVLGRDLPGAVKVGPILHVSSDKSKHFLEEQFHDDGKDEALHFSLAGVQLKFSGIWDNQVGLTIPVDGMGGSWIVKLPSPTYMGVPQNEYAMMELARGIGIDVPETALVPLDKIKGLPQEMQHLDSHAFVIKRFDRDVNGNLIHIEDFAQVFGVYPEKKYRAASYRNIAEVIWNAIGQDAFLEFIRRFIFNALIGNGDMHLKNWSLIYPDGKTPQLAPAYDYVSTLPYLPTDQLALNFVDSKEFRSLSLEQLKRFAAKSHLPEKLVVDTAVETVNRFEQALKSVDSLPIDEKLFDVISKHLKTIPLWASR